MKNLNIFLSSDNPDIYINTITHSVINLEVTNIFLFQIQENEAEKNITTNIRAKIEIQLSSLSEGKYSTFQKDAGLENIKSGLLNKENINIYNNCRKKIKSIGVELITYQDLEKSLKKIIKKGDNIFDVSGLKKHLLIDVIFILLQNSSKEVFVFELTRNPQHNQNDLIHNLLKNSDSEKDDYNFRNLFKSQYTSKLSDFYKNTNSKFKTWLLRIFGVFIIVFSVFFFIYKNPAKKEVSLNYQNAVIRFHYPKSIEVDENNEIITTVENINLVSLDTINIKFLSNDLRITNDENRSELNFLKLGSNLSESQKIRFAAKSKISDTIKVSIFINNSLNGTLIMNSRMINLNYWDKAISAILSFLGIIVLFWTNIEKLINKKSP